MNESGVHEVEVGAHKRGWKVFLYLISLVEVLLAEDTLARTG